MSEPAAATEQVRERTMTALREVIDPEVGLDVVELGLVYGVDVDGGRVHVRLTMTSPACPLGEQIVEDARQRLGAIDGVAEVEVELVWDPPWGPERMSPAAKAALGWDR